jgi:D-3-phosphoglycerate dehydrogenase
MAGKKCLIVDSMHESIFEMLHAIGWEYAYYPTSTREEIKALHHGYDGLIVRTKTTIDRDLLGENPTVRFIGRAGAGLDNLELPFLASKNITVLHASEGNRDAVGEFALGALLSVMRNIPKANSQVRDMIWDREGNRGEEIMGKTVGIIGYGNMGRSFAKRLSGFSANVLAYDKYKVGYGDEFATEASLETIMESADILSLHIPLTAETRQMVDAQYFNRFKKNIIFVNTARGEIASLRGIADSLKVGKLRAAVLDVLENEKLNTMTAEQKEAFTYLREQQHVILSPHIAGWTFESHVKINETLIEKIKAL